MASDMVSLLRLGMPGYDVLPYLVNIMGLRLVKYQMAVAAEIVAPNTTTSFVCEVIAPKRTLVRVASCDQYQTNNELPAKAVAAYIEAIERSDEWNSARQHPHAYETCLGLLDKLTRWRPSDGRNTANSPEQLIHELKCEALKRHKQHVANIQREYGRAVGLVSKRGTNRLRYAPNDDLLRTLLFCNVQDHMEYREFLALLYQRYGLIFGDKEAEQQLPSDEFDRKAFQANARRLEQRLMSLSLLKRLSDGCAYVINPYRRRGE